MRRSSISFVFIILSQLILAQDYYNDSSLTRKNTWHVAFNFPTTKGLIYAIGAEWQHPITNKVTYVTSAHISLLTNVFKNHSSKSTQYLFNIQPAGILIGERKWKFESNISFSYNASVGTGIVPNDHNGTEIYFNMFIGTRYALKKIPLAIHFGLMPRYNLVGGYYWYDNGKRSKFVPGFDVGFTYKLSKKKT